MGYRYETHMHTNKGSKCGKSSGQEHARYYKELGYAGIIVTDHFFGGNTAVPKTGSWKERVEQYCSGFEEALAEGQKIGLQVFFGIEENFEGDEYLIYGIDKEWMIKHPEMETWTRREQYNAVRAAGGCVIQAHPFRMRDYMKGVHVGNRFADGVEVLNGGNTPGQDVLAYKYAKKHGLYMTSGSDRHLSVPGENDVQKNFGIVTEEKLGSIHDYVNLILSKKQVGLYFPEGRLDGEADEVSLDIAQILDEDEKDVPMDKVTLSPVR